MPKCLKTLKTHQLAQCLLVVNMIYVYVSEVCGRKSKWRSRYSRCSGKLSAK